MNGDDEDCCKVFCSLLCFAVITAGFLCAVLITPKHHQTYYPGFQVAAFNISSPSPSCTTVSLVLTPLSADPAKTLHYDYLIASVHYDGNQITDCFEMRARRDSSNDLDMGDFVAEKVRVYENSAAGIKFDTGFVEGLVKFSVKAQTGRVEGAVKAGCDGVRVGLKKTAAGAGSEFVGSMAGPKDRCKVERCTLWTCQWDD